MSENQNETDQDENEHVRDAITENFEVGTGPYIFHPYPDNIVQIKEPDTRGGEEVSHIINRHWPATINEIEEMTNQELDDGYSGSFIRSVLRHNYVPEDEFKVESHETQAQGNVIETETEIVENAIPEDQAGREGEETMMEDAWHLVFRMGLRAALENNIERESAFTAFESGFIEGEKVKEEME